ncbi:glycine--tRNA ligase, partial [Acinetobacter baumannii]|nr:glycine--tRNA ligase [Acinetobacter baumannii]
DFDLRQHAEHSKQDMNYVDSETGEKFIPYCIEPSLGAGRVTLAFLCDAYTEEVIKKDDGKEDNRVVMKFHPALAPFKAA